MTSDHSKIALVLGATGGIGGETASALEKRGWTIRALSRRGQPTNDTGGWTWITGDALDSASVVRAAEGAQAIIHAVNPPGYKDWDKLVLPMIDNTLAAGMASGARIVLPGTIYNYGPDAFPVLREDSPQNATTHKGRIRIELEKRLERAAQNGVRSLIVRFGDFFGPKPGNNWFSQALVRPGQPVRQLTYPGKEGVGHAWTYLPDAGETVARLLERDDDLATFARFHFRGHWDENGTMMITAFRHVLEHPDLPVRPLPWFVFGLGSPFNETLRELYATRPLWRTPIELDNQRLTRVLGEEPHTPLHDALRTTLLGLGCL